MDEWFILLLLVPAIVVPAVLLLGFAGCEFQHGVAAPSVTIDAADGQNVSTIRLTWHASFTAQRFWIARKKMGETGLPVTFTTSASPFDDTGLEAATQYEYHVGGEEGDGTIIWSAAATGTTLPFETAFEQALTTDGPGWQGGTLILRIEPARLIRGGTAVRITVQAHSMTGASIDRVYISQPDPTGKPYDAAADLTAVYDNSVNPLPVPNVGTFQLPVVNYTLVQGQPLLIAVDFSPSPPAPASGVKYVGPVPSTDAVTYFHAGPEAALRTRSANYGSASNINFITKVEVG